MITRMVCKMQIVAKKMVRKNEKHLLGVVFEAEMDGKSRDKLRLAPRGNMKTKKMVESSPGSIQSPKTLNRNPD